MDGVVRGPETPVDGAVAAAMARSRFVQSEWVARRLQTRLRVIRQARRSIAAGSAELAATVGHSVADVLSSEVLPLVSAAHFLEKHAARLLAPRRLSVWRRPLWLLGTRAEIHREAFGVVLILAPGNYPLMLPGIQALQALTAGNAVCVKPAPGHRAPMLALAEHLARAGLPDGAFHVLDDSVATGVAASAAGFDRIVLTGSADTGRAVLAMAAETLTPTAMELSGNDAVFVLPDADLGLVAQCLAYGLRLKDGATCIAPRRVFVPFPLASRLEAALIERLSACAIKPPAPGIRDRLRTLTGEARDAGARVVEAGGATIVADAQPSMALLREDVFAPWLAIVPVMSTDDALRGYSRSPYRLGASIFGSPAQARHLARRIDAGSVTINELIVPTAHPRLPFGGRGRSGFGVTRGAEGLLDMTTTKTVSIRHGRFRPHLDPAQQEPQVLAALIAALYARGPARWRGLRALAGKR